MRRAGSPYEAIVPTWSEEEENERVTRHEEPFAELSAGLVLVLIVTLLAWLMTACAPSVVDRAIALDPNEVYYTPTEGDEMGPKLKLLAEIVEEGGFTVVIAPPEELTSLLGRPAYGVNDRFSQTIYLNSTMGVNTTFETLAHEAGHIFHAPGLTRETAEVFAELVGNRVQRFYGSRTALQTSSTYLAQFKHVFGALRFLEKDMDRAVAVLTGKRAWPAQEEQ